MNFRWNKNSSPQYVFVQLPFRASIEKGKEAWRTISVSFDVEPLSTRPGDDLAETLSKQKEITRCVLF